MRRWTYILLLCAVLAALGGLAAVANSQAGTHAEGEAAVLAAGLRADLARFEEHALHLARQSKEADARHLASFRGLVSAQRFDAAGKEIHRVERFGHIVAKLPAVRLDAVREAPPPPPNRVVVSGLEVDVERKDVHPDLRHVLRYAARTDTDGTLVLTVYAEPFLAPLREAGAALYDVGGAHLFGEAIDSGFRELGPVGAWWRVRVPVGVTRLKGGALLAYGAVLLGLFLLAGGFAIFLERQVRAQERAALEQRLARSERLGSIGLLATGIAHEINNPLEGIANWMRLGKTDKVQEGLDRIRKIVRDLLQFARPDVETGSADFVESFARALELARYAPGCKKLTAELEWPLNVLVACPSGPLEQVLLNLLLNAGEAARDAGSPHVDVFAEAADGRVRIQFKDNGPGIAPEDLPRLFDPFFTRGSGTGLGLSVSYGILKAVGGDLRAKNDAAGGACFTIELPIA